MEDPHVSASRPQWPQWPTPAALPQPTFSINLYASFLFPLLQLVGLLRGNAAPSSPSTNGVRTTGASASCHGNAVRARPARGCSVQTARNDGTRRTRSKRRTGCSEPGSQPAEMADAAGLQLISTAFGWSVWRRIQAPASRDHARAGPGAIASRSGDAALKRPNLSTLYYTMARKWPNCPLYRPLVVTMCKHIDEFWN
jgi:hypothetical protein